MASSPDYHQRIQNVVAVSTHTGRIAPCAYKCAANSR
jgi:hypothetical protein